MSPRPPHACFFHNLYWRCIQHIISYTAQWLGYCPSVQIILHSQQRQHKKYLKLLKSGLCAIYLWPTSPCQGMHLSWVSLMYSVWPFMEQNWQLSLVTSIFCCTSGNIFLTITKELNRAQPDGCAQQFKNNLWHEFEFISIKICSQSCYKWKVTSEIQNVM